jgi:hypothetical protein
MHYWPLLLTGTVTALSFAPLHAETLPESKPLTREGDLAAQVVEGWRGYFGLCQTPRVLSNLDAWIRRR